jgi:hypothetical protein
LRVYRRPSFIGKASMLDVVYLAGLLAAFGALYAFSYACSRL